MPGPEEVNDHQLVGECRQGRKESFDLIMRKYQDRVFNVAYRMTGNYDAAGELAQETFVRAYRGIQRFRGQSSLLTWMYSILNNACKNRFRYHARHGGGMTLSLDEAGGEAADGIAAASPENPAREAQKKETQAIVQDAISSLAGKFRAVLVLKDIEGLSYEEISRTLGCDGGTVKSRLHRARYMLREKLKDIEL